MSNTDRMSLLERWADGMETLEQYYDGKYGPPATPAQLPAITTYDGMLEAIADGMERAKRNINKKSPTYHSDSTGYTKVVPAGDVHYASLEQIGGRTLVWNQLVNPANIGASKEQNGITFTNNGDGSITVSGTAEAGVSFTIVPSKTWQSHYYCLRGCPSGGSTSTYCMRLYGAGSNYNDVGNGVIWYHATALYKKIEIVVFSGTVISTPITFRPTFTDMTLAFGSGNEPSTVEEFEAMFPADYYEYNEGTLLSAGVTEVVSKKADTTTIATYSIPAEVQALTGYGWSCPSHYNYIDFEAKKFVQEVGSRAYASGDESDSTVITDGTNTYYALNPAVETDISTYITDDNLISVESGGTLTFPNSNGDDYRIPVPSSETFVVGEP